jgi:diguanylate cyclase (GGDEF)-like protein
MGLALPRWTPLAFSPLLALAYALPLAFRGDPRQIGSLGIVVPICVFIGESVAWISNKLRESERIDGQRMQRMSWLVDASVELAGQLERSELAERIAQLAIELPAATCAAVLLPAAGRKLELGARASWPGVLPKSFTLTEEPALTEAMRTGTQLGADDPRCAELAKRLGVARVAVSPLMCATRCTGVVLLGRGLGAAPFDPFTGQLVKTLSVQAGLALERVSVAERLREASLHDELTGVGNRPKANARLERLSAGDALVLIDLDLFKQVNDTKGHAAGDEVLRDLGRFLTDTLRLCDEVFRMGGEEFLVVLDEAGDGAPAAAERLCAGWRLRDPVTTFSAGVAIHSSVRSAEASLECADAALYRAKDAGRDRVEAER